MMQLRILYQDEWLVAVDKPAGFQVHQPEDKRHHVAKSFDCLYVLRNQLGRYLHPLHRLDRATSGVLLFAFDATTARLASESFRNQQITKTYFCVTRGWTADSGVIDHALGNEIAGADPLECRTEYSTVARIESPHPVGKHSTARYSLVRVEPRTGRLHQIRRHFAHLSHPLIGDTVYGDGQHNRFFRSHLELRALLLKAHAIELPHPMTQAPLRIRAKWNSVWLKTFDFFGVCPYSDFPALLPEE
jgi:tRNA pseudouridine65 synthase